MSSQRDQGASETDAAERQLQALAEEMDRVIHACEATERDALHGYAVSLVRDRLPTVDVAEDDAAGDEEDGEGPGAERAGGPASLIGYGILLLFVGLPLVIVFPLVGILLLVGGAGMSLLGFVSFVFSRSARERTAMGGK